MFLSGPMISALLRVAYRNTNDPAILNSCSLRRETPALRDLSKNTESLGGFLLKLTPTLGVYSQLPNLDLSVDRPLCWSWLGCVSSFLALDDVQETSGGSGWLAVYFSLCAVHRLVRQRKNLLRLG
jgi:hypothetical protein